MNAPTLTPPPSEAARRLIGRRTLLRAAGAGGLLLGGGAIALLGGRGEAPLWQVSRPMLGTWATLLLARTSRAAAEMASEEAFAEIARVERLMSRFRAASDVGRLNAAREQWLPVAPPTAEVLATALAVARATEGCFDPCLERLVSAWGFHDHDYPRTLPPAGPPPRKAGGGWYRGLATRANGSGGAQVRLAGWTPGIDLGGIAKGYAIDRAVAALRGAGVEHALVNVGDDIFALGAHPRGGGWRIGVRHPRREGALLRVMELAGTAVATSGDYRNFFIRDGRRYHHLLDPHTGRPAPYHQSLTVTAPTAMLADALATAGFTAAPAQSRRLLGRFAAGAWLAVDAQGGLQQG